MEINLQSQKKRTLANINKLFNKRNDVNKFVDDYGSMILEASREAAEEVPEPEPSKVKTERKKPSLELNE